MSNFKIGEKVVCVDDKKQRFGGLILNEIYEVSEIHPFKKVLKIKGIVDYYHWNYRFRKLDHDFAENLLKEIIEAMKSETILN